MFGIIKSKILNKNIIRQLKINFLVIFIKFYIKKRRAKLIALLRKFYGYVS